MSDGIPLAEICRMQGEYPGMPRLTTVYDWEKANPDFSARVARAREAGYDMIAVEALRIADTPQEGTRTKVGGPNGVEVTTEDMLGHRKLRVEARLKLLACWDPKRYGASTTLKGDPDAPLVPPAILVPRKDLPAD